MIVVDRRRARDALPQRAADFAAGRIVRVQHAAHAVRRLVPERKRAGRVAIEPRAPVDELADVARAVARPARAPRTRRREPSPARNRVGGMKVGAVVGADGRRNAALRVAGVALVGIRLGEDDDATGRRERARGAQAGDAAANDEEVAVVTPVGNRRMLS